MANAQRKTIVEEVVKTEERDVVALELTEHEAVVLRTILNRIGGHPTGTRGVVNDIIAAFCEVRIHPSRNISELISRQQRAIYFTDRDLAPRNRY